MPGCIHILELQQSKWITMQIIHIFFLTGKCLPWVALFYFNHAYLNQPTGKLPASDVLEDVFISGFYVFSKLFFRYLLPPFTGFTFNLRKFVVFHVFIIEAWIPLLKDFFFPIASFVFPPSRLLVCACGLSASFLIEIFIYFEQTSLSSAACLQRFYSFSCTFYFPLNWHPHLFVLSFFKVRWYSISHPYPSCNSLNQAV